MKGCHASLNKGFLLVISSNAEVEKLAKEFKSTRRFQGATLFYDTESINTVYMPTSGGLSIYKGDKHLYRSYKKNISRLQELPLEEFTGTRIAFAENNQTLTIYTDVLGSEPIYYKHIDGALWITDRVDNFSRYFSTRHDLLGVYNALCIGASLADSTCLEGVNKTTELQKITYCNNSNTLKKVTSKLWFSDASANVKAVKKKIVERLSEVLEDAPDSSLMLSAGWDSRVLMCDSSYIKRTYTHGDLKSREIDIAFRLGKSIQVPMDFKPLTASRYGAAVNNEMLFKNGQCLFPHWYYASQYLQSQADIPMTSGMFVELFSGHFGVNIVPDSKRSIRTIKSLLTPGTYDKFSNEEAIQLLTPLLASGFQSLPWFFRDSIDFESLKRQYEDSVKACLTSYSQSGTSGVQELCERFKMQHVERQFMVNQTKSAAGCSGYHHPYADAQLNQLVLQLKYRHRIGYKLSRHVVNEKKPSLLDVPLAATLVKAKSPIILQELSRFVRIGGEKIYQMSTGNLPKGLGWNNFQFLNKTPVFHEYIDALKHPIWDKNKMHQFVEHYCKQKNEAYSLVVMLGRIATVDFQLSASEY